MILFANLSLLSCTEESLAEATGEPAEHYATDGGGEETDPEEKPPSNGE